MRNQKGNLVEAMEFFPPPPEQNFGYPCLPNANKELMEPMEFFDRPSLNVQSKVDLQMSKNEAMAETKVMPLAFLNMADKRDGVDISLANEGFLPPAACIVKPAEEDPAKLKPRMVKKAQKITAYGTKEKLLQKESFLVVQEKLHRYIGSYYAGCSRQDVARLFLVHCRDEVAEVGTPKQVQDGIELLFMEPDIHVRPEDIPRNLLSLQNGVLNIYTGVLNPHSKNFWTLYGINGRYLPDMHLASPVFDTFLKTVTGGDGALAQRILEFIGYVLTPDMNAKVFFVLQGVPNSGKSVLTTLLTNLFTENAVVTLDAHVFSDKYSISELVGKALCISPDLPAAPLDEKAVSKIKQITGNDVVSSNRKYESYVSFRCNAKIILVTNHPLLTRGNDSAFEERIVTIPFRHSVPKEEQDRMLIPNLLSERDAIITKAIRAYYTLAQNCYRFTGNYPVNEVTADVCESTTDVSVRIYQFVRQMFEKAEEGVVFTEEAYQKYCDASPRISVNEFSQYFKSFAEEIHGGRKDRKRMEGAVNATSCICGISWKQTE